MTPALKVFVSIVLCAFLVTACSSSPEAISTPTATVTTAITALWTKTPTPVLTPSPTNTSSPTPITTRTAESAHVVSSYAYESNSDRRQISAGNFAEIVLVSTPVIYNISYRSDGSVESVSESRWESHHVSEMQVCVSFETSCQLSGNWIPFELSPDAGVFGEASIQKFSIKVDWVGPRTLWLVTQFRDNNENPVFSVGEPYQTPQAISQISLEITGVWDEATPIGVQPPTVQTAIAATKVAYPLTGSVEIEEGRCCIGGTAGDVIQARVDFSATSPFGEVKDMRAQTAGLCFTDNEMLDANWEPITSSKTYPVYVALNWVGFYVSVQYRDEHGNLSPVYCDEIGVEGHPPMPTNTPIP